MEKKYQVVLLILLFITLSFISFLFSPFFNIREFVIHSRSEIDKNSLRSNLNKFYGQNLLFAQEEELRNDLLNHTLISSVEIEKAFPSTVHVIIEERKAVAWIENNNKKLLFSADGIILGEEDLSTEVKLPEIEGFSYYFKDEKVLFPEKMDNLLNVLSDLDNKFLGVMAKITNQNNIYKLYLVDGGGVNLGRNNKLKEKFSLLNSILLNNSEEDIDYINLQVIKHPVIKLK